MPTEIFPGYDKQQVARSHINSITKGAERDLRPAPGHVKNWDPDTARNLATLEASMAARPPLCGWVVGMHPWPIQVNGGSLMRESAPPAGLELFDGDELLVHRHIVQGEGAPTEPHQNGCGVLELPWYEPTLKPEEGGYYTAIPILPIDQAGQYAREGNSNALWGPGVLIYEGDLSPVEMWKKNLEVPVYDILGKPSTRQENVLAPVRGSRTPEERAIAVPVTGKFRDVFQEINQQRLANYQRLVNECNDQIATATGKEKNWFRSRNIILMANVLFKMKRIKKLPDWASESRGLDVEEATKQKCINCRLERKDQEHFVCICGWPFEALEAYKRNLIGFDHLAVSNLPIKELEVAYKIRKERDETKQKMEEKFKK